MGVNLSNLSTTLCTKIFSPQNSLGESHFREPNALRALPVYPVSENKKQNRSYINSVERTFA